MKWINGRPELIRWTVLIGQLMVATICNGPGNALASHIFSLEHPSWSSWENPYEKDARKSESYFSMSVLGTFPKDVPIRLGDEEIPQTSVGGAVGGGVKAGIFPSSLALNNAKGIVGFEAEIYGFRGDVKAPQTTIGGATRSADIKLGVLNYMFNVIARYPGESVQPYIGVGGGVSRGHASGQIEGATVISSGKAMSEQFGYQLLGGVRANMTERWFLFTEYKYFAANHEWQCEPAPCAQDRLDFKAHIVVGGAGVSF